MGKALAAIACGMGVLAVSPVARAGDECRQLPSGRFVRMPADYGLEADHTFAGADVITIDLSMLGEDSSASVFVSDLHQGVCDTAQTIDPVDREGPRSVAFGTDYVRFFYREGRVMACLPASGGFLSVGVMLTGEAKADDPQIVAMTQAIADAFVRGDCAGGASAAAAAMAPASAPVADTASASTSGYSGDGTVAGDLAQKDPFVHLRVTAGLDGGLSSAPGLGSSAVATLEVIGVEKNGMGIGVTLRGGPVLAGGWITGATGWFGPIGSSGKNVFGAQGGVSYDGISGGVLTAFAVHGRALYGRRLGPTSALELSLDGAWGLSNSGTAPYPNGASTLPSTDELALAATWSRGYYSIGVDYRELLGGRFLGVALGFGIGMP